MGKSVGPESDTRTAAEIAQTCKLSEEARALLRNEQTANEFFDLLYGRELFRDAVHFVAHLLPTRETVWWGCLCVWQVCRPDPPSEMAAALQAAIQWVRDPSEAHRKAAQRPGEAAGLPNPAGAVAMAVFWSGGSMTPDSLPPVPPPPGLTPRTIAAAVLSAVAQGGATGGADRYRQFLQLAIDVDNGKGRWDEAGR
jgi:hypothetical protein